MNVVPRPEHGLSLCAGGGGLDMGLGLAEPGFHTRCYVEWEEYPRSVLISAQEAGYLAPAPIWDDLTAFDARPFAGAFDTLLAGYPCQPFSAAGQRRGADDERHLWPDVARVARELGPGLNWIFLENVAGHVSLGLETVLRDLREMGFTPAAGLFTAAETGAAHERERVFIVAYRARIGAGEPDDTERAVARVDARGSAGGRGLRLHGGSSLENTVGTGAGGGGATPDQQGRNPVDGRGESLRRGDWQVGPDRPASDGRELDHTASPRSAKTRGRTDEWGDGIERRKPLPGDGCRELADPSRLDRPIHPGQGAEGCGAPDAGRAEPDVGHAPRLGCGEGRPEPELRSGWNAASGAGGAMGHPGPNADARGMDGGTDRSGPRDREGKGAERQRLRAGVGGTGGDMADANLPGQHAVPGPAIEGWPHGRASELRRPLLHAPGPADMDLWRFTLDLAPDLAPALSLGHVVGVADRAAQMVAQGHMAEAAAESLVRRMADVLAARSRGLRLLGNGVHPLAAAYAWRTLSAAHGLWPVDLGAAIGRGCAGTDELVGVTG